MSCSFCRSFLLDQRRYPHIKSRSLPARSNLALPALVKIGLPARTGQLPSQSGHRGLFATPTHPLCPKEEISQQLPNREMVTQFLPALFSFSLGISNFRPQFRNNFRCFEDSRIRTFIYKLLKYLLSVVFKPI